MPRDDSRRGLAGLMARVNRSMDSLYTSTYYTSPNNTKASLEIRSIRILTVLSMQIWIQWVSLVSLSYIPD